MEGSGAGTNLKVGGAKRRTNFFGRAPPLFGFKSTISRFDEHFCDGQYSLVSFSFAVLLLTVTLMHHGVGATGGGVNTPPTNRRCCK